LVELLEPPVQALGYELVDLDAHVGGQGLLRIYIDQDAGIDLSDCERVSRQLSVFLDVEDPLPGQYVLEVSSPGSDRPLRTPQHYQKFQGHEAVIRLRVPRDGRRKLTGRLLEPEGETVLLEVEGRNWRLELTEIESAHLVSPD
jgi:ribosome maturation factor RimP